MHIAIAYTNGKLKAYMDETRLLNIPRIDFDPKGLTLYTYHANNENLYYLKNIRIAEGGVKFVDGNSVEAPLQEALVTEDMKVIYPVEDDIPILLQEKGIGTTQLNDF